MSSLPKTYQIGHKIIHHLHQDFDTVRSQLGQFKNSLHLQGLMHGSTGALGHMRHDLMVGSATLVLLAVLSHTPEAKALPTGANMTSGHAYFTQTANSLVIYQNSWDAVIDWTSFNLGANESVEFYVPTPTSSTLNRINDPSPSTISGTIRSNGNLFFVNKNGMIFTGTSSINAPVIGLSTSDISITATDVRTQYNSTRVFSSMTPTSGSISLQGTVNATYQLKLTAQNVTMAGAITTYLNPTQGLGIDVKATNNITVGSTARISAIRYSSDSLIGMNADHDITVQKGAQISAIASNDAKLAAITMKAGSVYQHGDLLVQKHGSNDGLVKITSSGNMEFDASQFSDHASVELNSGGAIWIGGNATYKNFKANAQLNIKQDGDSAINVQNLDMTATYNIELYGNNSIQNVSNLNTTFAGSIAINNTGSTNIQSLRTTRGNISLLGGTYTVNSGAGTIDSDQDVTIAGRIEVGGKGALTISGQSIRIDNSIHGENGFTGNPVTFNVRSWQGNVSTMVDAPWGKAQRTIAHTSPQGITIGDNGSVSNFPVIAINDHNSAFNLDDSLSKLDTFNFIIKADGTVNYNLSRNLDSINVTAPKFVQTAGNNLHIFHVTLNVTDSATLDGANNYIKQLGNITNSGSGNITINTTTPLNLLGQVNINTGRFDVKAGSILLNRFVNINSKGGISLNGAGGIEMHNEINAKAIEFNSQGTIFLDLLTRLNSTDDINLNSFSQLTNNGVINANRDLYTRGTGAITVNGQFGSRYAVHVNSQGSVLFAGGSYTYADNGTFAIENGNSNVQLLGYILKANDLRIVSGGAINFNNGMLNTNNLHIIGTSTTQFNLAEDMNLNIAGEVSIHNQGDITIGGKISAGSIEIINRAANGTGTTLRLASGSALTSQSGLTLINTGKMFLDGSQRAINITIRADRGLSQGSTGSIVTTGGWLTIINSAYGTGSTFQGLLSSARINLDLNGSLAGHEAELITDELLVTSGGAVTLDNVKNKVKSITSIMNNGYGDVKLVTRTNLAINGDIITRGFGSVTIDATDYTTSTVNTITIGAGVTQINTMYGSRDTRSSEGLGSVISQLYNANVALSNLPGGITFGGRVVMAPRSGTTALFKANFGGVSFRNGETGLVRVSVNSWNDSLTVNGVAAQTKVMNNGYKVRF
ncbi:MAG: filamentous hemagglutinin N-terminal domain-containing protein [Candidatus Pacebacteria bacterium]|nr:filamentous hemagglutinin N-terminal domain-containing protein [Candidatus Paceibacterota bacterium]